MKHTHTVVTPDRMTRDELIQTLAEVIAGLQVPISISGELGTKVLGVADAPARKLLGLVGGWAKPEEFATAFTKILDGGPRGSMTGTPESQPVLDPETDGF